MSTMLCAWARVDDSAHDQYARHVAEAAARLSARTWHFEAERNPALEFEHRSCANFFTIYEVPPAAIHQGKSYILSELTAGTPDDAHVNAHFYEELGSFRARGYSGGYADLRFLGTMTHLFNDDATCEAYYDWTRNELIPQMLNTPGFLRARYYKAIHADLAADRSRVQREESRVQHLCIYELDSDDWLWDVFFDVGQSEQWRNIEKGMELEMKKWYLRGCYPDDGKAHVKKEKTEDDGDDE